MAAPEDAVTRVVEFLIRIPGLDLMPENRNILLTGLPRGPLSLMPRHSALRIDLDIITKFCFACGYLTDEREADAGRVLAIEKLLENARPLVNGLVMEKELDVVLKFARDLAAVDVAPGSTDQHRPLEGDHPGGPVWVNAYSDSLEEPFIKYLEKNDTVWIVGITNEHLTEYLERAFTQRGRRRWEEVRIIFQARHLVGHFGEQDRAQKWDEGLQSIVEFFLHTDVQRARKLDIRHANRILPFVGQIYEHRHVRVAFVLPVRDIRNCLYLNYALIDDKGLPAPQHGGINPDKFYDFPMFLSLKYAFENLRNSSTPLLAANVVGRHVENDSFLFATLIPQNNWRHDQDLLDYRPFHLVTFVMLYHGDRVLLQYRNEYNSTGQRYKYAVLPGKVNDEDFLTEPADRTYWEKLYKMQRSFDALAGGDRTKKGLANDARVLASQAFSTVTGIQTGQHVPEASLRQVSLRAAIRSLDEKLGLDIASSDRLVSLNERGYVVRKQGYSLYIKLFALSLNDDETTIIPVRRPFSDLHAFQLEQLKNLKRDDKLTLFLEENFDDVLSYLGRLGVK